MIGNPAGAPMAPAFPSATGECETMNIQEREEMDYQAGAASDMQNAMAWSMMNRTGDDPKIGEALAAGRFVVVCRSTEYCRATDAIMGSRQDMESAHATRAEAEAALAAYWERWGHGADMDDHDMYILPAKPAPAPVVAPGCGPIDDDELPF